MSRSRLREKRISQKLHPICEKLGCLHWREQCNLRSYFSPHAELHKPMFWGISSYSIAEVGLFRAETFCHNLFTITGHVKAFTSCAESSAIGSHSCGLCCFGRKTVAESDCATTFRQLNYLPHTHMSTQIPNVRGGEIQEAAPLATKCLPHISNIFKVKTFDAGDWAFLTKSYSPLHNGSEWKRLIHVSAVRNQATLCSELSTAVPRFVEPHHAHDVCSIRLQAATRCPINSALWVRGRCMGHFFQLGGRACRSETWLQICTLQ